MKIVLTNTELETYGVTVESSYPDNIIVVDGEKLDVAASFFEWLARKLRGMDEG